MKNAFISFCLLFFALVVFLKTSRNDGQNDQAKVTETLYAVNESDSFSWMQTMTSPEMQGGLEGDTGDDTAANRAANKLASCGLPPLVEEKGFLQNFDQPHALASVDHEFS